MFRDLIKLFIRLINAIRDLINEKSKFMSQFMSKLQELNNQGLK